MNRRFLSDGIIDLRLRKIERNKWFFPVVYFYDVYMHNQMEIIGRCDYRCKQNEENYYAGNIGYMILPKYRGNSMAYRASLLLCGLAKTLRTKSFYITCSPDNIASYNTIKKLGAEFIEEVMVPENHFLFRQGEKVKYIFLMKLHEK